MNICSVCSKETISQPYDWKDPVYCTDCNPKYKCTDCGEPRKRPIGHTEYCDKCFDLHNKKTNVYSSGPRIIDNTKVIGQTVSNSHYKHIHTRVTDDNGNSLSGKAGIDYMKSKGGTYASRLKEYYK